MSAFLDTNVLYGALISDLTLSLVEGGVADAYWSEGVLDELRRALVRNGVPADSALRRIRTIRSVFGSRTRPTAPASKPLGLPDAGDEFVVADALRSGCTVIVTYNLDDFPPDLIGAVGLTRLHPDTYLARATGASPAAARSVIEDWLTQRYRPRYTLETLCGRLGELHMPKFASALSALK